MKYHIAFLTYDWNTEIASLYIKGVSMFVHEHPDTAVHIYDGFGDYEKRPAERSEFQVFNLPDLSQYDGIVLQGNRVWEPKMRQLIADRASAYGLPVVSINYPLDQCWLVGSDNYNSSYAMCEHLIVEHHCASLAVIAGLLSSAEAKQRLQAALDCAHHYGIENVEVYGNEWDDWAGAEAVKEMIRRNEIPDGIVCGNDNLAFGAEMELLKNGFKVPEDVKIVGFDNLSVAEAAPVRISTVNRNYPETTYLAMQTVYDLKEGKEVAKEQYASAELIFAGSCGCGNIDKDIKILKEKYLRANRYVYDYYKLHNALSNQLDHAKTIGDIADVVERNAPAFEFGNVYMIMNGLYLDNFGNTNPVRGFGQTKVLVGLSEKFGRTCGANHVYEKFYDALLPSDLMERENMLQVYALQSEETCIGYIVSDGDTSSMEFNFLETAFSLIVNAVERIRRISFTESLNERLSALYVTEPLTGLYNRFGLEQNGSALYERLLREKKEVYICFVDIDDLKSINDAYGHECGDEAIRKTAEIIKQMLPKEESFAMRYGGDEFVTIQSCSMKKEMKEEMERVDHEGTLPYHLCVSIGEFKVSEKAHMRLQEAIESADDAMYERKHQKQIM